METFDITKKSDIELKALGFDVVQQLELATMNLRAINAELSKRANASKEVKTETPETSS